MSHKGYDKVVHGKFYLSCMNAGGYVKTGVEGKDSTPIGDASGWKGYVRGHDGRCIVSCNYFHGECS